MSFAEAIKKAEVKEPKTKKSSSSALIDYAPNDVKVEVDNLVHAKAEIKKNEAIVKKAESVIIDYVRPIQDEHGFKMQHSKSYDVVGNEETVKYVTQDRFTVNSDDEENLKELFGEEGFNERFEKVESLSAKQEIFSNETLQKELLDLLGEENFAKFFEYKATLKTKKGYDVLQYKDKDKLEDSRVFVKQYKAALK